MQDLVILDMQPNLTADAAIGAQRVYMAVGLGVLHASVVHHAFLDQRSGRADLHTFTTRHTGTVAHRVVEIESDFGIGASKRHPDHIIDLHLTACPHTEIAVDTGIQVHMHRWMTDIMGDLLDAG